MALDVHALRRGFESQLDEPAFRAGVENMANDPFLVAFFLVSVSQGEGLGEAAVAMIGREEVAKLIRDLERQQAEEAGHKQQTIDAARELFPEFFDDGRYRYEGALEGVTYYRAVLKANRDHLKKKRRYSRLNLYLTTTLGYEVMTLLLYEAVAQAVESSSLPPATRDRVVAVLERILAEEETHLGVVEQHEALLKAPRMLFSDETRTLLELLDELELDDYRFAANLAVEQVIEMMSRYADSASYRERIEARASG
jgi:hypothetical protein